MIPPPEYERGLSLVGPPPTAPVPASQRDEGEAPARPTSHGRNRDASVRGRIGSTRHPDTGPVHWFRSTEHQRVTHRLLTAVTEHPGERHPDTRDSSIHLPARSPGWPGILHAADRDT